MNEVENILERVKAWANAGKISADEILDRFPELKESEDERIRKVIRQLLWGMREEVFTAQDEIVTKVRVLAWLEKQKEQKPMGWSDEDTEMYINVASSLREYACGLENEEHKRHIKKGLDWLENRFKSPRPQSKQEWNEEEENKIESIKGLITMGRFTDTNTIRTIWKLLDSLRPSWKPSEQ